MDKIQNLKYREHAQNNKKSSNNKHELQKTSCITETTVAILRITSIADATLRKKNEKYQIYRISHLQNIQITPEFIKAFATTTIALFTKIERTADTIHNH
ncbi:conserved hypothetical protein [Coccidioides posadasii str. Silveira]|uniref:Uncharacterized protein n=1 Tax=Coccidioides posadasii (strain RMSCC 757 / Silveira) TaxID=443226 RepID=E9DIM2_COCPS|nr:conserved hypothetical protein [Coccidioides posadasii str. Silveira]